MAEPRGIAVDNSSLSSSFGDVYVADQENNRIDKFGPEGEFLLAWGFGVADGKTEAPQTCTTSCFAGLPGAGAGQFQGIEGIAVDSDPLSSSSGDVYVADIANSRIEKFNAQGEFLLMLGGEVDKTTSANICTKEDIAGGDECGAGVPGPGPGAFEAFTKHAVAVDQSTGTLYVADSIAGEGRVQRFSEAGAQLGEVSFPGAGFSQNLAVDSAANIYLKGEELSGVRKYEPSGKELPPPRDEAGFGESKALAIGPADELFINHLEGESHHILTFNSEGEQSASFDAGGEVTDGGRGIAYSSKVEALYVLNATAVRIVTPPPPGPLIVQGSESASEIQPTAAMLGAIVNPEGLSVTKCHFEYGTSTTYGQSSGEEELKGGESQFEDQPASEPITGLSPATEYHFRATCENAAKEVTEGPDQTFTTLPPVSIDATSASEVNDRSARLEAELNPHGLASEYHFEYDTSPYTESQPAHAHGTSIPIPDASIAAQSSDVAVSELIQGLEASSTYHYRVIANNALGETRGADHSFKTQGPSATLADGRAWELVSPANKHGAPLEPITEEGGLIQAASGGGAFAYVAAGTLGARSKGGRSPEDSQLLSRRDPSTGWSTEDISTAHEELSLLVAGELSEYTSFAEDLSAGALEPKGATALSPQASEKTPYRREADGEFVPLVNAANVPVGAKFGGKVTFEAASPDLNQIVLSSSQVLAAGFEAGFVPNGSASLYELSRGKLSLVSVLPNGKAAAEEGASATLGSNGQNMRGAVSEDGGRVFFGTGGQLLMRDVTLGKTLQLDEAQPGASGKSGGGAFQAASRDGSKVFFSDSSRLTADATAKPGEQDLYMCEIGVSAGKEPTCALTDLSVDHNAGEAANVEGMVTAIDQRGAHVYFVASGILTSAANQQGEHAVAGGPNLYEYDTDARQIELVAVLSSADEGIVETGQLKLHNLTARSSPDGRYFAFMSQRSLTGYDNHDVHSGQPDEEAYLFDSVSGALRCLSCNPSGSRPLGVFDPPRETFPGLLVDHPRSWRETWLAGSIAGWTAQSLGRSFYQSRFLSNSGRTFFNSSDQLVPQDTNKVNDVYQYEPPGIGDCSTSSATYSATSGGCVSLISSGTSKEESAFLDASENGDEAFFLTGTRLTSSDIDGAFDVYDAHVCSASSPCPPPPPPPPPGCEGDSCLNLSAPPAEITPGSLTYKGPENAKPPVPPKTKAKAKLTKAQLLAKALKACKKKRQKAKRQPCEKQARKKYGAKKAKKAKAKKAALAKQKRKALGTLGRAAGATAAQPPASPQGASGLPSAHATQSLSQNLATKGAAQSALAPRSALSSSRAPAPWWRLSSRQVPAHLAPGGEGKIIIEAVNLGNAPSSGKYEFSDQLPPGLTLEGVEYYAPFPPAIPTRQFNFATLGYCSTSASSASCSSESENPFLKGLGELGELKPAAPYEFLEMRLKVKVEATVQAGAINQFSATGGGAAPASAKRAVAISDQPAGFGVGEFALIPEEEGGQPDTHAGSHPYQLTNTLTFNRDEDEPFAVPAPPRNLHFKLPPGLIGNATALPQCNDQDFAHIKKGATNSCPSDTAIGVSVVTVAAKSTNLEETVVVPVFNLTPAQGEPARFGFEVLKNPAILDTAVRSGAGEDYGVTVSVNNITEVASFISATTSFWGVPGDPSHNSARSWGCLQSGDYHKSAGLECEPSNQAQPAAFMTMPTNCKEPYDPSLDGESWPKKPTPAGPAEVLKFGPLTYNLADSSGNPLSLTGCNQISFAPSFDAKPSSQSASSPSGLDVNLNFDDEGLTSANGVAQSQLKDTTVTLPEGLTINPSSGRGLGGCTTADYEAESLESPPGAGCPNNSKLGSVEITTPLLKQTIHGSLFIAEPFENPFPEPERGHPGGTLVAIYIVAKNPEAGILLKLAGKVTPDPVTGRLTTTFLDNPQLPFSHFNFHFREGQQAPLITPPACGSYESQMLLTPWSEPLQSLTAFSPFSITSGSGGGACPPGGLPPFSPQITSGTINNTAGAPSPFYLRLSRTDGEGEISSFSTNLPPGLSGILTGIPFCPESDIAVARAKSGVGEQAEPSCPAASLLGHSEVGTGVGSVLSDTPGQIYLAGPYNGDPFSLVSVTSAVVGPFDLGTVVVRFGLRLDPHTTQVSVDPVPSEPIPHVIDGIVTHVRDIRVTIDRPGFTINPTSCNTMSISSTLGSNLGQSSTVSSPFQAASCQSLKFAPKFSVSTAGKTSKANGASLSVKLSYPSAPLGSYANLAKAKVSLPKQLPSRLTTLQKACTAAVFDQNPANCPSASIVGHAKVLTLALPVPLEGPAYFVSHGGEAFPDLTIVLKGYGVTVDLIGSTSIKNGVTTSTFKATPDVPFNSFELTLPQGPNSALAANANLCKSTLAMPSEFTAQNGAILTQSTPISVTGCGKTKPLTRKQKLAKALKGCQKKHNRGKRRSCEGQARRRFGGRK